MIPIIILSVASFIFAGACIILRSKNKSFSGMVCKFMASFGFIGVAVIGNYVNGGADLGYFSLICFALMFGFCGDIFLGIKEIAPIFKKKLVILGTAFFLIGHVVYLIGFFKIGASTVSTVFLPLGVGVALIMIAVLKINADKKFKAILTVYYALLIFKLGASASLLIKDFSITGILLTAASVLFIISDTCLGIIYFTPVKKKNGLVMTELSTYYPAQLLFALSVVFIGK